MHKSHVSLLQPKACLRHGTRSLLHCSSFLLVTNPALRTLMWREQTIVEFRSPITVLRLDDKQPAFSIAASAGAPRLQLPARRSDKGSDQCGDLICSSVQREMTRVENVNFSVRYIL